MALVVLLRGVNVGGHRTFRPSVLVQELKHLDAVNIGAAGTFVIRRRVSRAQVRAELARWLPFDTAISICDAREVVRLMSRDRPPRRSAARVRTALVHRLQRPHLTRERRSHEDSRRCPAPDVLARTG